jgi:hypothetical protein
MLLAFNAATNPARAIATNRYEPDSKEAGAKTTNTPAPSMDAIPIRDALPSESLGLTGEE